MPRRPPSAPAELEGERCTAGDGEGCAAGEGERCAAGEGERGARALRRLSSGSVGERSLGWGLPWERGRGEGEGAASEGSRCGGVGHEGEGRADRGAML
jgi:hypothetical protein